MVLFLRGRIATQDGTAVPHDAVVERVCNAKVRQQVYASGNGDFTMELGSLTDSMMDASGESDPRDGVARKTQGTGIPRMELVNCEIRTSISGFLPKVVNLAELTPSINSIDVGSILVERSTKVKGTKLNARAYKAPDDARKAYEKGLDAEAKGKLAAARQYFEKAVGIYPKYADAWFQLGTVLRNLEQKEPARMAFGKATAIDGTFLPPFLSLASMAYEARDWNEVLSLSNHVVEYDPLKYGSVAGYMLDLDPLDFAEAFFYNSAANFQLNNLEAAEKSGLKAERLDLRPRFPQLHLLLAEIFARKANYSSAIAQAQIYLQLAPQAREAERVRARLAELEKLNAGLSSGRSDRN